MPIRPIMTAPFSPIGQPTPRPAGRRSAARVRLNIPAKVLLLSGQENCLLDNLSETGARVAVNCVPPRPGSGAVLMMQNFEAFGIVVWSAKERFGIAFETPLSLDVVVRIRDFADHYSAYEQKQRERMARSFVQGAPILRRHT